MENKEIIQLLKLTAQLLELHGENPFKIRAYTGAVFNIEKTEQRLFGLSTDELQQVEGIKKGMSENIFSISQTGSFDELNRLIEATPEGVREMLSIKGLGPKKIKSLWQDHNIEDKKTLLQYCMEDKISGLKGFGKKTQESIKEALLFAKAQEGKFLYAEIEAAANHYLKELNKVFNTVILSGQIARKLEIIDSLTYLIESNTTSEDQNKLIEAKIFEYDINQSSPFIFRGTSKIEAAKIECHFVNKKDIAFKQLQLESSASHLNAPVSDGKTLLQIAKTVESGNLEEVYANANTPFCPAETREGYFELDPNKNSRLDNLITYEQLKGPLHNHSTYSDGKNTLEEIVQFCISQKWEYIGISDHSKTAFYANGLDEDRIRQQHEEIDALNKKYAPFVIFKGIESDILNDGSLDYEEDVLKSFDYIVSSVHSNLSMPIEKSMPRLIKAIENPYTTFLGHMTGRLLLRRDGYPVNHRMIIDACAANDVIIEINSNPWRLDIDWRWVDYCIEKGVMLSINPDAHVNEGFLDMYYGVQVGRKGGLTPEHTFNTKSVEEVAAWFSKK